MIAALSILGTCSLIASQGDICLDYSSSKTVRGVNYRGEQLNNEEIRNAMLIAGKIRKQKEVDAHVKNPLIPQTQKMVRYTQDGVKQTVFVPVYHLRTKEDKRRFRAMIQEFVDNKTDARTFVFYANEADLVQVKTGKGTYDVAVAPTKKRRDGDYTVKSPPPYGEPMCKAVEKILKIIEGSRSETARCLRHIAQQNDDFIGSVKGGRARMQKYDQKAVARRDQEKIAESVRQIFIKYPPQNKPLSKHLEGLLNTETDSPSFWRQ
jgi:hypothetical protein